MKYIFVLVLSFFFVSCSSKYSLKERLYTAEHLKMEGLFHEKVYKSKLFDFRVFYKIKNINKPVRIYIEGDGLAWISRHTISSNPTPINPIAFKLASFDNYENVIYLPRVCQYITSENCKKSYWTDRRFSKEVISSTNEVINKLKRDFKFNIIDLIGFSGGAAISILVASKRDDIKSITTIAGNLNHKLLHELHNIPFMKESLNPIDYAKDIKEINQTHYYGSKDKIVYKKVIESFVEEFSEKNNIKLIGVDATHNKGWIEYFKTKGL